MSEKGGTKKSSAKKASGVDSASRVATIGGIWAIVVAIVAIIGLGSFIAGYNYGANGTIGIFSSNSANEYEMSYKRAGLAYTYGRENENEDVDSQLLNEFNGSHDRIAIINSKERYDALLKLAKEHSMLDSDLIDYDVDENFFKSGSVIAISAESTDLTTTTIKNVLRDDKYNVTIQTEESEAQATITSNDYIYGQVYFIKIDNVKPKSVKIVELDEE